ncbi:hypothetical protein SD81_008335 [Tolypothrix campylonemoides VB511288]|nr:hypothetical protein SD81_008335 [Tolypothrix campylonemoides VB511288]
MMIGKVNWFGGFNNKKNKINNFGFITPLNGENPEKIYVCRNDVPVDVQNIIEGKKGEGIYVKFNIDSNSNKAINIELVTFVAIVEWVDRGICRLDCDDNSIIYFRTSIKLKAGDILYCAYKVINQEKTPIIIQLINYKNSKDNVKILERCTKSTNKSIFLKFIINYLLSVPLEIAFSCVIEKISYLDCQEKIQFIDEIINVAPNLLLFSSELRSYLEFKEFSLNSYGCFIDKYLDKVNDTLREELLNELIDRLKKTTDYKRSVYWNQVKYLQQNLEYGNFLWDIAPIERKKQVIQKRYSNFFETVCQFHDSGYPYAQKTSCDWRELYKLNEEDKTLIIKWDSSVSSNSSTAAKMISARGAEKLAIQFYKALGYTVEDISAHQVTQKSQDWITGDIKINSKYIIDVKNARSPVNSDVYSEFCVPAFKTTLRASKTIPNTDVGDVGIIGVLSPYLKKEEIDEIVQPSSRRSNQRVSILGTFNQTKLKELKDIFSDDLMSIDMSRGFDPNTYLPHWVFDYDKRFYVKQREILAQLQQLQAPEIPTWEDISIIDQNPLPLFIAAKRKLLQDWLDSLPQWKTVFINYLIVLRIERISLPDLFLALLKHFLSMLSYDRSDYSPQEYLKILYTNSDTNHPLKLYDPLNTIKEFCDTLQTLWRHREKAKLNEFKIFKFNGQGLLQGKQSTSESNWTRILAYCGNKSIEGKGKCGYTPLVIGEHETCQTCRRLICPQPDCRHCYDYCSSYLARKPKIFRANSLSDEIPF